MIRSLAGSARHFEARPRRPAIAAALLVASIAACHRGGPLPLCLRETAEPNERRTLPATAWFSALLVDYDRATRRVQAPVRDCTRAPVRWETGDDACPLADDAPALPPRPLDRRDLVIQPLDPERALIWIITARHADGDGLGPAAQITWGERGFAVWMLGPLRAPTGSPRLRLEPLGEGEALVVDGDRCVGEAPCVPVTIVVPVIDRRFTPTPIRGEGGRCDGPPRFERARQAELDLGPDHTRRFELTADLRFVDGALLVDEAIAVHDLAPSRPDDPPRAFRQVAETRTLRLRGRELVADRPPLWTRALVADGRVDGDEAAAKSP